MRSLYLAMIAGSLSFTGGVFVHTKYWPLAPLFTAAGGALLGILVYRRVSHQADAELFNRALYGKENPRCFCPECNAYLGHFYANRIRMQSVVETIKFKIQ